MNRTALLIALVVVVLLAGYAWYVKSGDAKRESASVLLGEHVLLTPREQIAEVDVVRGGGLTASFRRAEEGGWETIASDVEADPSRIPDVLYGWSLLRATDKLDGPAELSKYGLEQPALELRATSRAGEETVLAVGDRSPLNNQFYALLGPDEVFLVDVTVMNVFREVDMLLGLTEEAEEE